MRHRFRNTAFLLLVVCFSLLAYAMERQPNSAYQARRKALAEKAKGGVVIWFAPMEKEGPNALYGFRQEDNFYYLTGLTEPGAGLLIASARPATEESAATPYTEILFLPGRNVSQEKWTGPKLTAESADVKEKTGFDQVMPLDRMRDELVRLLPSPRATILSDLSPDGASKEPLEWLKRANAFPNYAGFRDGNALIASLRVIKDEGEMALIRKGTDASVAAHFAAMHMMKPGLTEQQVAARMIYEFEKRGAERPAYAPIVGSGFYSTVLHYSANVNTIQPGDLVVMDVAGEYSMYASDITRTLPANGKFTARQKEIYDIVLGAQRAAIQAFQSGSSTLRGNGANSLYKVAMDYINSHGKDKHGQPLGQYFIHGLSHFVGLNVHDVGNSSEPLQPGMVFTIEPGIYIPEENLGVRIEDIFWVDPQGQLVNLSGALPHSTEEVEQEMAKPDVSLQQSEAK